MSDQESKRPFDDPHELRAFALKTAADLHQQTIKLRLDRGQDEPLAASVLVDAKAFEAFVRTGRIPPSHRIKPDPEATDG